VSILIRGAQVLDGTGKPSYQADALVQSDRISAIGNLGKRNADHIIEAAGMYIAPGFIDVNTDADHYLSLFTNPSQKDFLLQGVTTIIGGHCGSSLAPLLYGTLESVRKWADPDLINVDWHTVAEFLAVLERRRIGVNFGTFVGHSTVRRSLTAQGQRELTKPELAVFRKVLQRALEEGAFGLSTGLGYVHGRGTPYKEIKALLQIVADFKGIYATHLRSESEGLLDSVRETVTAADETHVTTIISHFKPLIGFEKEYHESLQLLEGKSGSAPVYFDMYPYDTSASPIYTLLPLWAQGNTETMMKNITDPELAAKIIADLREMKAEDITIASAPRNDFLIGKTLASIARNQEMSAGQALLKVLQMLNLRGIVFYKNINFEVVLETLHHSRCFIASNGSSLPKGEHSLQHERSLKTFPKFLQIALRDKLMPLHEAIKKITSFPAEKLNLKDRGVLQEKKIADLVVFKNAVIQNVIVNGELVVENGTYREGALEGKVLRHND